MFIQHGAFFPVIDYCTIELCKYTRAREDVTNQVHIPFAIISRCICQMVHFES